MPYFLIKWVLDRQVLLYYDFSADKKHSLSQKGNK